EREPVPDGARRQWARRRTPVLPLVGDDRRATERAGVAGAYVEHRAAAPEGDQLERHLAALAPAERIARAPPISAHGAAVFHDERVPAVGANQCAGRSGGPGDDVPLVRRRGPGSLRSSI